MENEVAITASYLQQVDVREVWDHLVRPGLVEIREAAKHDDWRPEDVYHELRNGNASLLIDQEGFVILRPKMNPYTNEKELLIWFAWSHAQGFQNRALPQIESIGRNMGAVRLLAMSHRRGLEKTGWDVESIVYKRAL